MTTGARRSRGLLTANVVVATLLIGAIVGLVVVLGDRTDAHGAKTPSTSADKSAQPPAKRAPSIENRRLDTAPLSEQEVFPEDQWRVSGHGYRLVKKESLSSCLNAIYGSEVGEALEVYECSQVVRATIVDDASQVAATIGVANMADAAGAAELDALLEDPRGNGAFTIMNSPDINEDLLRKSKILVDHNTRGHFVLFTTVTKLGDAGFENSDPAVQTILADARRYLSDVVNRRIR